MSKRSEHNKKYYQENKDLLRTKSKIYRDNNKDMIKEKRKETRRKGIEHIRNIKLERGCESCGYNENALALQFDHIDPSTKKYNVGSMSIFSIKLIDLEIAKCRILCANCHFIKTHSENQKTD